MYVCHKRLAEMLNLGTEAPALCNVAVISLLTSTPACNTALRKVANNSLHQALDHIRGTSSISFNLNGPVNLESMLQIWEVGRTVAVMPRFLIVPLTGSTRKRSPRRPPHCGVAS